MKEERGWPGGGGAVIGGGVGGGMTVTPNSGKKQ
jgi:hypothetical protein